MGYDVVICSDINRTVLSRTRNSPGRRLVAVQGGGFCMIGGYTAFGAGKWGPDRVGADDPGGP